MLLFYCTSNSRLPSLRQSGTRDVLLWRSLEDAQDLAPEVVLAVDSAAVFGLGNVTERCLHARRVPPEAFLNLDPHLPVVPVTAAGGVVLRSGARSPEVLLIHRDGRWDLPKGKQDPGETVRETAIREVREETGIQELTAGRCIGATLHGYPRAGRYHVKRTYWYRMESSETEFTPALEEGITDIAWTTWDEAVGCLGYPTLRNLMQGLAPLVLGKP